ncbi:hypothetical protein RUM43_001456 [Polyplax serrata]|uniref:Uncharacterized protein n=1 Tax=Polyplax serrata TaxID=468196 RepID=A0AAN8SE67_POLSC
MEIVWVMRVSIIVVGILSTVMALTIPSIYGLWSMCSDLVYCILFPQLLMVVHFKHHCNTYGSLAAYIVAFFVRLTGGESLLGLPALIKYPGYDYELEMQLFPFRTLAMVLSLGTLVGVSWFTKYIFESGKLAPGYDFFRCVVNIPDDVLRVDEPIEGELSTMTAGTLGKLYGATGLVGKDEMNGRINPGLEPDDDLDAEEIEKLKGDVDKKKGSAGGSERTGAGGIRMNTFPDQTERGGKSQGNTAF